ncbi:uncharacterized protein MELLADRAFT_124168 [Melampsora larici-populina 98AG31]|uniref:Secreted protein n=1 Tax=Melampsora larici-populina (strain 98AG31 / pathotype 3-4-7) TaxID=747676 RepID=F4RUB5_MELLP|nr:uncharacterized protein MELLADRAFT_124168 [Melampsora larici-populina 98AG31]EGG04028.1 secreted protein [Melampsora larici-populina 98AG31]
MFHQYPLKVAVLLCTFYLSTLIGSSASKLTGHCNLGLTGVFPDHSNGVECDRLNNRPLWCNYKSCWHGGNKWVKMNTCRPYGSHPDDPRVSAQDCVDYVWVGGNTFTCTNPHQVTYSCYDLTPQTTPYITCTSCDYT